MVPKRAKVWVCLRSYGSGVCEIFAGEPERYWRDLQEWDMAAFNMDMVIAACTDSVERFFGVKIPPHPQLLEIERVGDRLREVCVWEPCEEEP